MTDEVGKRVLSAEEILSARDIQYLDVFVPEWGEEGTVVRLRSLTAEEITSFTDKTIKEGEAPVLLLALSVVDEDGKLLFTRDDVRRLKKKNLRAISRLQDAALDFNGLKDLVKTRAQAKND